MVLRQLVGSTMYRVFVLAVGLATVPGALAAQKGRSILSVGVADAETGAPIAGVEVVLPDLKLLARSDASGQARVPNIPFGTHRVRVRFLGYSPSDVQLKFES